MLPNSAKASISQDPREVEAEEVAGEAEAVEAEAVEAEAVEVEAVEEDHPPHNHHNSHSNNRMLSQQQTSKLWENSPIPSMATVQKQKISLKKSKDTSVSTRT